ncbi:MAG: UvrD-helicase domain-containing protein [Verrucomicrobiota bacterium]
MPGGLQHELVTASAGFGKTHRLVSRLLALLTQPGESAATADSIAALTFSRAAAGEILDTLVRRLASAALDDAGAAREKDKNSELPEALPAAAYREALQQLLARMHTSFIGTIDSFFLRILQAFGPDLGVPGQISMLDEHDLVQRRTQLLGRLLAAETTPTSAGRELGEAFKHATHGQEAKSVTTTIGELCANWHHLFLRAPQADRWGDPRTIWGTESPWLSIDPPKLDETISALRSSLAEEGMSDKQWAKWEELIAAAQSFTPTTRTSLTSVTLFGKLLEVVDDLAAGRARITNYSKMELSPSTCRHALDLLHHIVHCELRNRVRATEGIHELLLRYESLYHRHLRRRGLLTFGDVPSLLTGRAVQRLAEWDPTTPAPDMMHVNYRLDGQLDHWALDEFQDTSRRQWGVLHDLVEEVLHASPPERTFFAVGDVKQAIYGWRGGDVQLMAELRDRYAAGPDSPLRTSQLPQSYRSSQSVLDLVNATFEAPEEWPAGVPEAARRKWADKDVWCRHEAAIDKPGFAAVVRLAKMSREAVAVNGSPQHAATAAILTELDAGANNLSVAVLVRANREGAALTEYLREAGIDARWDGDALIADNPVVAAILAALRAATHPADTLAGHHRQMTPLAESNQGMPSAGDLLRAVEEEGFQAAIERLVAPLRTNNHLDDFAQFRVRQLLDAARRFDTTGSTDVLDFDEYVRSFTVRDLPAEAGVRVMTLHRSKGLGFDVVILPDLDSARIDDVRAEGLSVAVNPEDGDRIDWLLDLPPRAICEADPVLTEHRRRLVDQNAFETLCLLYVGMTRAKQGLYALTVEPGKSVSTLHMGTFLQKIHASDSSEPLTLNIAGMPEHTVLSGHGDPNWFGASAAKQATEEDGAVTEACVLPLSSAVHRPVPLHRRRLPSESAQETPAAQLFAPQAMQGAGFGTLIHALFEQISWLEDESLEEAVKRWRVRHPQTEASLLDAAENAVRGCLAEPDIAGLFHRPAESAELRREQSFELLLEGRWVSGVFDRVVLCRSAEKSGGRGSGNIIDFKSDRVETPEELTEAVEFHRPQLLLYRRALARIADLQETDIGLGLVFTHARRLVNVARG